jgi:MFS family permease
VSISVQCVTSEASGGSQTEPAGSVWRVREFRVLWAAGALSIVGDQFARVALSVLVYQRTGSAVATAATYALTQLPSLVSGVLLTWLADRFPRRTVMIACHVVRAGLVTVMALPGVPILAVAALLVVVQLLEPPFASAQAGALKDMLPAARLEDAQRALTITHQTALLGGFGFGGVLAAGVGTSGALLVDAGTFVVAAVFIAVGIQRRPAATERSVSTRVRLWAGAHEVWSDRRLLTLLCFGCLAGFTVAPEGLAAPIAGDLQLGSSAVGWLLAAEPAGMVVGGWLSGRLPLPQRLSVMGVLAIGTAAPLVGFAAHPPLAIVLVLLALSGVCSAYQITAAATFLGLAPGARAGQAWGFARSGLITAQGLGVAAAGVLAEWVGSAPGAIAIAGVAGVLGALAATLAWLRIGPLRVADALLPIDQ